VKTRRSEEEGLLIKLSAISTQLSAWVL